MHPADDAPFVIRTVSHFVYQNGFDLLAGIMDELATLRPRVVLLGTGRARLQDM